MTRRCRCLAASSWRTLPPDSQTILWSLRQLVICWPRSPILHATLIDRFGDEALGVEHLLRCLVAGIGMHGRRKLRIGTPSCIGLLADETELLEAIGLDGAEPDPSALVRLCASPKGLRLAPLADALGQMVARAAKPARALDAAL